jgi:imidazolonepropionase-like amidohydrolase
VLDAKGGLVTPGLVDSHTHLVFAGERAGEFALRCSGKSYLDVALSGGGIAVTTRSTQAMRRSSTATAPPGTSPASDGPRSHVASTAFRTARVALGRSDSGIGTEDRARTVRAS